MFDPVIRMFDSLCKELFALIYKRYIMYIYSRSKREALCTRNQTYHTRDQTSSVPNTHPFHRFFQRKYGTRIKQNQNDSTLLWLYSAPKQRFLLAKSGRHFREQPTARLDTGTALRISRGTRFSAAMVVKNDCALRPQKLRYREAVLSTFFKSFAEFRHAFSDFVSKIWTFFLENSSGQCHSMVNH